MKAIIAAVFIIIAAGAHAGDPYVEQFQRNSFRAAERRCALYTEEQAIHELAMVTQLAIAQADKGESAEFTGIECEP